MLIIFSYFSFHCSSGFLKFLRYIVAIYVLVSRALPDGGRALNPLHSISSVFFGFPFFEDHKALVGRSVHWKAFDKIYIVHSIRPTSEGKVSTIFKALETFCKFS